MADLDMVLKLCPGTKKMNLHASYCSHGNLSFVGENQSFTGRLPVTKKNSLPESP